MKRVLRIVPAVALLALLPARGWAQSELLKPFRPGNNPPLREEPGKKPPKEETARPPREEAPKPPKLAEESEPGTVRPPVVKPADPSVVPPPKNVPDPTEPIAIRPKILPPDPKPAPSPAPAPDGETPAAPAPPKRPPAVQEMPEPDDIVVRPNAAPTSADQVQLRYADGFFARKMWRDAVPEYERYLDQFPKASPDDRQAAFYRLGECYRQTGATNNAKANYEAVVNNYSGGDFVGYAAYRLATILYDNKDYRAALPIYRKANVRLKQPTLINATKFFIARCLEAIGQKTEARVQYDDLSKLAEANPYRDASRLSVGRLYEEGNQRAEALKWLIPLSAETTNAQIKTDALCRAGLLQVDIGQYDAAEKSINEALSLPDSGPWRDRLEFSLFRILSLKKAYKELLERYDKGAASGFNIDNKLNVLVLVAEARRELGQRDAAMAIYDQIAHEFPTTPQARDAAYLRLTMLYDTGDARLLEEVNKFLTENPTAPQVERVSLMKAEALFKAADFEHAAPIYQIILEKGKGGLPGDFRGEAAFKLGWCYMQLRHYDRAIESFTKFVKDHPTHAKLPMGYAQRAAAYMQLKQYTAAEKDLKELSTRFPKAKEREFALENLALVYSQLGDQARMSESFDLLLRDYPDTLAKAKAHYWIGSAALEAKDYKKVIPHMEQARALEKSYFERASQALMASHYNLENLEATEKEIDFYQKNGGKAETPSDVIRWLGQQYNLRGDPAKAEKFLPQLILRKDWIPDDMLILARARVKLGKYKDAVDNFNGYLTAVKEPNLRTAALIEKIDAQLNLQDWAGAEATLKEGLAVAPEGKLNGEMRLRGGLLEVGRANLKKAIQIFEAIPLTLDDDEICPRAIEQAIILHRRMGSDENVKRLENQLRSKYPEYLQKKKLAKP
jgi:tetratricopeptide (TPR) repeat protein